MFELDREAFAIGRRKCKLYAFDEKTVHVHASAFQFNFEDARPMCRAVPLRDRGVSKWNTAWNNSLLHR
ncbi:hypothetical protein BG58_21605 [Caballeronia jiangsuensis]|nr:hypothetical protein BG58_21605 [Caballeronia jiangsuensis]